MAISFVGSTSIGAANGGDASLDLTTISDLQPDDIVIVGYAIGSSGDGDYDLSISSPTGYTANQLADLFADDNLDAQLGVFWRIQDDPVDTSVVCVGGGNMNNSVAAVAMAFRGVDDSTPMDVTATTDTGTSTSHANPPSIDHNNPSGVWTVIVGASAHLRSDAVTYTFPTGYTTDAVQVSVNDTDDVSIGMGYRSSGVSDPENPGAMTLSGTDSTGDSWCAVTIALRPASGATNVNATVDNLIITERTVDVNLNKFVSAGTDSLVLTTNDADVNLNKNVAAGTDSLVLTEFAATVDADVSVEAGTDALILTEFAADIGFGKSVNATVDNLILTEFAAAVNAETNVLAGTDALAITTFDADVDLDKTVAAGTDALVLSTHAADVNLNVTVEAGTDALILTAFDATITTDQNVNVEATVDELTLTTHDATVTYVPVSTSSGVGGGGVVGRDWKKFDWEDLLRRRQIIPLKGDLLIEFALTGTLHAQRMHRLKGEFAFAPEAVTFGRMNRLAQLRGAFDVDVAVTSTGRVTLEEDDDLAVLLMALEDQWVS